MQIHLLKSSLLLLAAGFMAAQAAPTNSISTETAPESTPESTTLGGAEPSQPSATLDAASKQTEQKTEGTEESWPLSGVDAASDKTKESPKKGFWRRYRENTPAWQQTINAVMAAEVTRRAVQRALLIHQSRANPDDRLKEIGRLKAKPLGYARPYLPVAAKLYSQGRPIEASNVLLGTGLNALFEFPADVLATVNEAVPFPLSNKQIEELRARAEAKQEAEANAKAEAEMMAMFNKLAASQSLHAEPPLDVTALD